MSEEKDRKIVSHSCNLNGNCALFTSVICNSDLYFESFGVFTCLYSTALCMSIPFDMPHLTLSVDKKMYALFIYCTHCDCWWDVSGEKKHHSISFWMELKDERICLFASSAMSTVKLHFHKYFLFNKNAII